MGPRSVKVYVVGCFHIDDQKFVEVLVLVEARLNTDFPRRTEIVSFPRIESLDDRAGMFEMMDSQPNR